LLAAGVFAHLDHDSTAEMAQRAEYMASIDKRSLSHYATKLKARGNEERLIARREDLVENRRRKQSIERRDFTSVLNTYHLSNDSVTPDSLDSVIFVATHAFSLPKSLRAHTVSGTSYILQNSMLNPKQMSRASMFAAM